MTDIVLWGFDASTYVRTIKMVLAEKGATYFKQVQLNVLKGEPRTPEHLERHPFGKVPVLDHDGMRILETSAIARYLNDVLPGKSLVPLTPKDRARMDMIIGMVDFTATAPYSAAWSPITSFQTLSVERATRCERAALKMAAR